MANDPRISSIIDANNLDDIPDADLLAAKVILISNGWKDKTVEDIHRVLSARSPVLLWEPASGRIVSTSNTTIYNLNSGLSFETYTKLAVVYDNHSASSGVDTVYLCNIFPKGTFDIGDKPQIHTLNQWKQLEIVSVSSFKINAGSTSNLGIKRLYGLY